MPISASVKKLLQQILLQPNPRHNPRKPIKYPMLTNIQRLTNKKLSIHYIKIEQIS